MTAKQVFEDLERRAFDKKQKIEKIHKETGQSNRQLSSTTVTDRKEPDQSNRQLSSTTVTDTKEPDQSNHQLSSATVTDTKVPDQSNRQLSSTTVTDAAIEESKDKIYVAFKTIFSDIKIEQIHNCYFCQQGNCRRISSKDLPAMSKDNKFQHKWFFDPKYAYCEKNKNMEFSLY